MSLDLPSHRRGNTSEGSCLSTGGVDGSNGLLRRHEPWKEKRGGHRSRINGKIEDAEIGQQGHDDHGQVRMDKEKGSEMMGTGLDWEHKGRLRVEVRKHKPVVRDLLLLSDYRPRRSSEIRHVRPVGPQHTQHEEDTVVCSFLVR